MCRSKAQGGRRCPGRSGHPRSVKSRKSVSPQSNPVVSDKPALTGLAKFGVSKKIYENPDEHTSRMIDYGYLQDGVVSGVVDYKKLDEDSHKDFGFSGKDFFSLKINEHLDRNAELISQYEMRDFTDSEKNAAEFFTTNYYATFNGFLYGTTKPSDSKLFGGIHIEKAKKRVAAMDSFMEKAPKKQKILYKGIYGDAEMFDGTTAEEWAESNLKVGSELVFDGYQSSSFDPEQALRYGRNGIVYEILTPEGVNIVSVSQFQEEREVILPRDSRYMIVGKQKASGGYSVLVNGKSKIIKTDITVVQLVAINSKGEVLDGTNADTPKDISYIDEKYRDAEK